MLPAFNVYLIKHFTFLDRYQSVINGFLAWCQELIVLFALTEQLCDLGNWAELCLPLLQFWSKKSALKEGWPSAPGQGERMKDCALPSFLRAITWLLAGSCSPQQPWCWAGWDGGCAGLGCVMMHTPDLPHALPGAFSSYWPWPCCTGMLWPPHPWCDPPALLLSPRPQCIGTGRAGCWPGAADRSPSLQKWELHSQHEGVFKIPVSFNLIFHQ